MRAFAAADDVVIVTAPTGDFLLEGPVYQRLIPLLDGIRETGMIGETLREFGTPEVYYAIRLLEAQGCLADGVQDGFHSVIERSGERPILCVDDPLAITDNPTGSWTFVSLTPQGWWIGPRFGATGQGPCWKCLEFKMLAGRPLTEFAREERLLEITPPRGKGVLSPALMAVVESHSEPGIIIELSATELPLRRHVVQRRPECPACGDGSLYARTVAEPVVLQGGPETDDPEGFAQRHAHLLDPITGIARNPRKLQDGPVHVYVGGANRAQRSSSLADTQKHLRAFASGKGMNDATARASLTGELAERYSAMLRGDEPRITGSLDEIGDAAIHPNSVMLFSEAQLRDGALAGTGEDPVPACLSRSERIEWTPVWSLSERRQKLLPTALLYFVTEKVPGSAHCIADSNGNAAGASRDAAMLQGIMELIERDAVGIWWFNRIQRPALPLGLLADERVEGFVTELESAGREAWLLDITTDLGIPVYAAVSRSRNGGPEQLVFGFGAHVNSRTAALRALSELGQTIAVSRELARGNASLTPALTRWMNTATLADHPFLEPSGIAELAPSLTGDFSAAHAFEQCRARIEGAGMECLVLDQTRPDVGVPVVKMLVPGLRHYRRRLAPGRLYESPVRSGWMESIVAETDLNPEVLAF